VPDWMAIRIAMGALPGLAVLLYFLFGNESKKRKGK